MNSVLADLLRELERFGVDNDKSTADRVRRMLNITRDTGEFLATMVYAKRAQRILEIGTSNGYSTLWLADAATATGGQVTTIEYAPHKIAMARENFVKAGLSDVIRQINDDAGAALNDFRQGAFDLIFLDSERNEYVEWWPKISTLLPVGGLLVVDNATSHAQELETFFHIVRSDTAFFTSLLSVGNGEFLAVRLANNENQ